MTLKEFLAVVLFITLYASDTLAGTHRPGPFKEPELREQISIQTPRQHRDVIDDYVARPWSGIKPQPERDFFKPRHDDFRPDRYHKAPVVIPVEKASTTRFKLKASYSVVCTDGTCKAIVDVEVVNAPSLPKAKLQLETKIRTKLRELNWKLKGDIDIR